MATEDVAAAATRALQDKDYALAVLRGEEDQPDVRNAILAEISQTRDRALASLPKDQARHLRSYMREVEPGDAEVFDSFIRSDTPAGALLVNLGADFNASCW
ncbi:MAG: hypothetical protein ABI047_11915 [Jatrophihabitantaceae bacterium]